jgi:uncharacterized membrane protein YdbT with pleckstrin-like domain
MILDEYLNYLQEDDDEEEEDREEEDQGTEEDEDDEEEVEEKFTLARRLKDFVKDPSNKKRLLAALKKHKKKITYSGLAGVGGIGFYAARRSDKKGKSL